MANLQSVRVTAFWFYCLHNLKPAARCIGSENDSIMNRSRLSNQVSIFHFFSKSEILLTHFKLRDRPFLKELTDKKSFEMAEPREPLMSLNKH